MAYITKADLENALGKAIVNAIFDDDSDGVADEDPVNLCLRYASAKVDAYLVATYDIALPIVNPPDAVIFAAIDFACAYAMRRRPDLTRAMGEKPWSDFLEAANANMKMFASTLTKLPAVNGSPKNEGGTVIRVDDGLTSSPADEDVLMFGDMGDFR